MGLGFSTVAEDIRDRLPLVKLVDTAVFDGVDGEPWNTGAPLVVIDEDVPPEP